MSDKPVRPSDTREGKIIRGASAGMGIFLSWLMYTKKAETEPPPQGCGKGCVLIIICFIVLAIVSSVFG